MSAEAGVMEAITALTAEMAAMGAHVHDIKDDVVEIRRQTTVTNGRVNGLEARETAREEVAKALALERAERLREDEQVEGKRAARSRHREALINTGIAAAGASAALLGVMAVHPL